MTPEHPIMPPQDAETIKLVCEKCGKTDSYARSIDPVVPAWVATLSQSQCDECHDGDRIRERWLNAAGEEPDPALAGAPQ